jgi:hypothetical protein
MATTQKPCCGHADQALYQAKHDGRNTYRFYEPGLAVNRP